MENSKRINYPARWSEPLDSSMNDLMVERLLEAAPFTEMDPSSFSDSVPLSGILMNDSRLHELEKGDIIVREGDYGGSAFLIVSGEAIVSTKSLPPEVLGRNQKQRKGWSRAIAQLWRNSKHVESRDAARKHPQRQDGWTGLRDRGTGTGVFLHDIPRVIAPEHSLTLGEGEIFGEISALTRSARSATVVANSKMLVLEIRWQGFREMMLRNEAMGKHIEARYRENSLRAHLRETEIFRDLSDEVIGSIADRTIFQNYGNYQWSHKFKSTLKKDISQRILNEPLISEQGDYVDGLILIRNGFARLSRKHGEGHQTIAYLGKGDTFGFREIAHNWATGQQRPWMLSLRSLGFVDVLKIPVAVLEEFLFPNLAESKLPAPLPSLGGSVGKPQEQKNRRLTKRAASMDRGLMEFLVENRFINGTEAMMIDLERCTRCDDCVRACAATHDNNPRFIRHGPIHDHWMVANACMHCLDPVCMIGCPTGAIGRDRDSGNVTINDSTCIGCSTCANNCPYHNIQMVEINDRSGNPILDVENSLPVIKATKCDLCLEQPSGPACQRACPHDALVRIDLSSPQDMMDWTQR